MTTTANRAAAALRTGSALTAVALATLFAAPAFAQIAPTTSNDLSAQQDAANQAAAQATPTTDATPAPAAPADNKEIVITGTISRNPAAATASPVVSVTADDIQKRGISTVTEMCRR